MPGLAGQSPNYRGVKIVTGRLERSQERHEPFVEAAQQARRDARHDRVNAGRASLQT